MNRVIGQHRQCLSRNRHFIIRKLYSNMPKHREETRPRSGRSLIRAVPAVMTPWRMRTKKLPKQTWQGRTTVISVKKKRISIYLRKSVDKGRGSTTEGRPSILLERTQNNRTITKGYNKYSLRRNRQCQMKLRKYSWCMNN